MAKKKAIRPVDETSQFTPATPASLRALASLLGKYVAELEVIAKQLEKSGTTEIYIRGRTGVDSFVVRLDGYVHNANLATVDKQKGLKIGEPFGSYHVKDGKER